METYAPIPAELWHRTPPSVRKIGTYAKVALLVGAAFLLLRFAFEPAPPMFRNFGVIDTPLGKAVVACGGEVTGPCGETTALVFSSCNALEVNFPSHFTDPEGTDHAVRELIGKRPPSGSQWSVACGGSGLARDRAAYLKPT